jgi:hypothetical protein
MMEEAYTIGIRFALDDGVSAGIAVISNDLVMLERAVTGSEMKLARLHAFSSSAERSAAADIVRPAKQGAAVIGPLGPPANMTQPGNRAQLVVVPQLLPTRQAAPVARVPAAPSLGMDLLSDITDLARTSMGPPKRDDAPQAAALAPNDVLLIEHHEHLASHEAEREGAPPLTPLLTMPTSFAPDAKLMPMVQSRGTDFAGWSPVQPPGKEFGGWSAPVVPPVSPVVSSQIGPSTAVAPVATMPTVTMPTAASQAPAPVPTTVVAQHPAQATSGPSQGDVFLDGIRVGRWMTNMLAREAARPQSGATPFDARMGPSWPGMA